MCVQMYVYMSRLPPCRCRSRRELLKRFDGLLPKPWLKPRPQSDLNCFICAPCLQNGPSKRHIWPQVLSVLHCVAQVTAEKIRTWEHQDEHRRSPCGHVKS